MCFNLMVESCILPCRHRFCIQCMRQHLEYGQKCPLCRFPVPSFFKMQYYHANVDQEYKKYIKRKFPAEYEAAIQKSMKRGLPSGKQFPLEIEIGFYYNGYENPSYVTSFEQTQTKSEWTIFIRCKNPTFRPLISQFISYADFSNPKDLRFVSV